MRQIWMIAWREVSRLRQRFSGGVTPLAFLILVGGLGLLSFAVRDTMTLGYGLYRIGVMNDAADIQDNRFVVMPVDASNAQTLLQQRADGIEAGRCRCHGAGSSERTGMEGRDSSAAETSAKTPCQSPRCGCLNNRALGYHGLS